MLEEQREELHLSYRLLGERGLTEYEHTEVTICDWSKALVLCRPASVRIAFLRPEDYLVVSMKTGAIVEGKGYANDTVKMHMKVYEALKGVDSIASAYSRFATVWAQAGIELPCIGVAHANRFSGPIPVTRLLEDFRDMEEYRTALAEAILEAYEAKGINYRNVPAILIRQHGPLALGSNALGASENLSTLELVADIALQTLRVNPGVEALSNWKIEQHFESPIFHRMDLRGQKPRISPRGRIG